MERITVVIEGVTDAIHLGLKLAGGKVVSASLGDALASVEPDDLSSKQLEAGLIALANQIGPNCMSAVLSAIRAAHNASGGDRHE